MNTESNPNPNPKSNPNPRTITRVIVLTSFCSSFLGSAVNIVVPSISADLSVSAGNVGWVITVYALATCGFSVPFGKLADATGRNRIFLLGLGLLSAACLGNFLARSFAVMLVMRALQGTGAAMIFATNTAIIVGAHPPDQRGGAIGRMLTGTYVGLASGPVLSGVLNRLFGWQSIFLAVAVAVLISLIPAARHLPLHEEMPKGRGGQDIAGNLLFIVMILCTMYGFASIGKGWWPFALIACGILLGAIFVRVELAAADPVVDVRIFRSTPAYTLSNLAALFNYCGIFGISYFMSLYLQVDLGYSSHTAGLIMVSTPLMMAALTTKMGSLSDRIAPYKLATAGMAISCCCLVFFSLLDNRSPLWAVVGGLLIAGIGSAVFSSPNMNAIMSCVDRAHYGVASSVLATMRTLGQTSGIAITTIVVSARLGQQTLQEVSLEEFEGTMHLAFRILAGICFAGMLMSMKRKDTQTAGEDADG